MTQFFTVLLIPVAYLKQLLDDEKNDVEIKKFAMENKDKIIFQFFPKDDDFNGHTQMYSNFTQLINIFLKVHKDYTVFWQGDVEKNACFNGINVGKLFDRICSFGCRQNNSEDYNVHPFLKHSSFLHNLMEQFYNLKNSENETLLNNFRHYKNSELIYCEPIIFRFCVNKTKKICIEIGQYKLRRAVDAHHPLSLLTFAGNLTDVPYTGTNMDLIGSWVGDNIFFAHEACEIEDGRGFNPNFHKFDLEKQCTNCLKTIPVFIFWCFEEKKWKPHPFRWMSQFLSSQLNCDCEQKTTTFNLFYYDYNFEQDDLDKIVASLKADLKIDIINIKFQRSEKTINYEEIDLTDLNDCLDI